MRLETLVVGMFATNCYVVGEDGGDDCAVIDPGAEGERVAAFVRDAGLTVAYVLATHGHADHTGGIAAVMAALGGQLAAPEGDLAMLERPDAWMTAMLPDFAAPPPVDVTVRHGDELILGGMRLRVLATPGHTPGGVSFVLDDVVFAGDTLFQGSIGRTDLPGGDMEQELVSIRDVLFPLGDDVTVLSGHGPATTIGQERRTNPFLAGGLFV